VQDNATVWAARRRREDFLTEPEPEPTSPEIAATVQDIGQQCQTEGAVLDART